MSFIVLFVFDTFLLVFKIMYNTYDYHIMIERDSSNLIQSVI